jgi:hypothetical protein
VKRFYIKGLGGLHRGCRQFEPVIAHQPLQPQSSAGFSGNNFKSDDLKWPLKEAHFGSGAIMMPLSNGCSKRRTYFKGPSTAWQRSMQGRHPGGGYGTIGPSGLKLLVAYENTVAYQPRFDFYGIGERSFRKNISIEMDEAITRAIRPSK